MLSRIIVVPLAALLLVSACGGQDDGRPVVVASFYPLQFLVQEIAGDAVSVVNLTEPGTEPHDLDPSVKQVGELADAALVVYSKGLQPAVDGAVEQNAKASADVSTTVDLEDDNPHFWQDPVRMIKAAETVEEALAEQLPGRADDFAANLDSLRTTLEALDQEYTTGLSTCSRDQVVTTHDAFGYLGRYGLRFAPIAGLTPDAEPSPAHLADLRDLIRAEGLTTVFTETIASPKLAETLSADLGLTTAVLDPLEGLREGSDDDYVSVMEANLATLQQAGGCTSDATVSP